MSLITFRQVKSNGTDEMHDQIYAPLEFPPSLSVALDPGSFESEKIIQK